MDTVFLNFAMLKPTHPPVSDEVFRKRYQQEETFTAYLNLVDSIMDAATAAGREWNEDERKQIEVSRLLWMKAKAEYETAYLQDNCQHEWVDDAVGSMWFVGEGGCDDNIETRVICRKCGKILE